MHAYGFFVSLLLHGAALVFFSQPTTTTRVEPQASVESADTTPLYIDLTALKDLKILRALPVVTPSGPGGAPGISRNVPQVPEPVPNASTATHPNLTIIVNPLKPENNRQAIQQTIAPPDLKLKVEQQLPDIVLVDGPAAPKPEVDLRLQRPLAPESVSSAPSAPAPSIDAKAPELAIKITSSVQEPKLPVSYFTPDSMRPPREQGSAAQGTDARNPSADASGSIVVMSVEPATFSQLATLAQGNRYGALAVAPSKEGPGSPGGRPNGAVASGGSNGTGTGGDASAGVGAGKSGGGGAAPQIVERASFSAVGGNGTSGGVDTNGLLSPVLPLAIYPVNIAPKLRRAPMVISAGPMGGGGLDVYGALNCGKVYSIFLPMPGKNWVLQYCAHEPAPVAKAEPSATPGMIRMQPGLVPPSPTEQFDFRRLPVPDKDNDKLIIVQATIEKSGAVTSPRVFQGVLPAMDAAAVQALAKWKFEPATRGGAPADIDALVGIPARLPEEPSSTSSSTVKMRVN